MRRAWTKAERQTVGDRYADEPTATLARELNRTESAVYGIAGQMGLKKSEAYLASPAACRLRREQTDASKACRFKRGQVPHNKGIRRPGWHRGRMRDTQFKPGEMRGAARHNYRPVGSTRINYGNLERKITDDPNIYPAARWKPVHRLLWESANGAVPRGHIVVFKPGMHSTDEGEIALDRLECISRGENMRRNTLHRYPKEIAEVMQLKGALTRQINKRSRAHEEQD